MSIHQSVTVKNYYLYPSTIFVGKDQTRVTTILGSCVAICLCDPYLGMGGINHYMLPLWNGQGLQSPKYGNIAVEKLVQKMLEMGSAHRNLSAKVFGGGLVLNAANQQFNIGYRNSEYAVEAMLRYNIPIIASSTGGSYGRKIIFDTRTGEVEMKYLKGQK